MKKRVFLVGVLVLFFGIFVVASSFSIQSVNVPYEEWNKTFGVVGRLEQAYSIIQTTDGGYAIAGYTQDGGDDFLMVKIDSSGNQEWNQSFAASRDERPNSIIQTTDGGYVLAGYSSTDGSSSDMFLVKIDSSGNEEWNQTFSGEEDDSIYSIIQTTDGGYAIIGNIDGEIIPLFGISLPLLGVIKMDSNGNQEWNKTFGVSAYNELLGTLTFGEGRSIFQTTDGGYVLIGKGASLNEEFEFSNDFWLIKIDSSGNEEWNKTFGGVDSETLVSSTETTDGGYAMIGEVSGSVWLVKIDSDGNQEWNRTLEGIPTYSLIQTTDGGYAVVGSKSFDSVLYARVAKLNPIGEEEWNQTLESGQFARSIVQTTDGGYALAGATSGQYPDFWIVKLGDSLFPEITIISPSNETEYAGRQMNVTFAFNVTDSSEITNCSVYVLDSERNPFTNKSNETAIIKSEQNNISILLDYGSYSGYVNCTDYYGNENNSIVNYFSILYTPVEETATASTSSGGSSASVSLGETENFVGKTNLVRYGFQNKFSYGGESHKFVLRGIDRSLRTAEIDVYSDKKVLTLSESSSENVDLDGDGEFDLTFYLDKIYDDKVAVDLRIENFDSSSEGEVEVVVNEETDGFVESETSLAKWILIFGVLLVIGIVVLVLLRVGGKKRK